MPKGKHIVKALLEQAAAAVLAAIEIHNKPSVYYRYQTVVILVTNAWELVLKAFLYREKGKKAVVQENGHTITFSQALIKTCEIIQPKDKNILVVKENLFLVNDIRCAFVHYTSDEPAELYYLLIYKSILMFADFVKKYFNYDVRKNVAFSLLPIGFDLPVDPIKFLKDIQLPKRGNNIGQEVINSVKRLNEQGVQESVIIDVAVHAISAKKINNADIIASIDPAGGDVKLVKYIQITKDKNAPSVRIDQREIFPLGYNDVTRKVKEIDNKILLNRNFNQVMKEIKNNPALALARHLDPENPKSSTKWLYSEEVPIIAVKKYNDLINRGCDEATDNLADIQP